jgi:methylenetetrahydrofolate reductase (NADPH)
VQNVGELKTSSHLERVLLSGTFAVTAECGPPRSSDPEPVRRKGELLKDVVDAVNVTDNQTAVVRMSSVAACVLLREQGLSPVLQMTTRDRNRIALESDLLGAAALGLDTVLCLSGDHQRFGDHPGARNVYDIDSIQLVRVVRRMRDEGSLLNGKPLDRAPKWFIGAAANPFAEPLDLRVLRLAKKAAAGADFIQTQCVYDLARFRDFMARMVDQGLHERLHVLAGVMPLKSAGMARYVASSVPGISVPDAVIQRVADAGKGKAAAEGLGIAIETIQELREIPGVAGVHVMAVEWEEKVREIVAGAGLLPRPSR